MKIRIIALCMILVLTGCAKAEKKVDDGKLKVYASFYAMYDFALKIGGDRISLTNLVPDGSEPHNWEPSPKEVAELQHADLLIYSGGGMEPYIEKIKISLGDDIEYVETAKSVFDGTQSSKDPHVWLNPQNAKKQFEAIKDAFVSHDSANKQYYEDNFKTVSEEIDKLDKDFEDTVATFQRKDIVVAHEAYGYLCERFGLKQVAIEGLMAESEPSPAKMKDIIEFVSQNNVKYIFFEELISPKIAQTIADATGAKLAVLNPFESGIVPDYFDAMYKNLESLKLALFD